MWRLGRSLYRGPVSKWGGLDSPPHHVHVLSTSHDIPHTGISFETRQENFELYCICVSPFFALHRRAPLFSSATHNWRPSYHCQYGVIAPLISMHVFIRLGMDSTMFPSSSDLLAFSHRTAFRTRRRKDLSPSHPPGFVAAIRRSSNAHAFSMGFRSGEYGGSPLQGTPTAEFAACAGGLCKALSPSWSTPLYSDAQCL